LDTQGEGHMKSSKLAGISGTLVIFFCTLTVLRSQTIAQTRNENHSRYKVLDLGTLGGSFSQAFGVNNRGDVVGFGTTTGDASLHAFLWRDGLMTDLGILGAPDTLPYSIAVSINNSGKVVGNSEISVPDPFGENFCGDFLTCQPVVWESSGITSLPTLGGSNGVANNINEFGEVGGAAENNIPDPTCVPPEIFHFKPVLWKNGHAVELPTIGDDPDGFVVGVNDRGEAIGFTLDCAFSPGGHSVLWRYGKALDMNASGSDPAAEPSDINNQSQIAGTAFYEDGSGLAMLWQNGATQVIGALPGHLESHGNAINNERQIVGQSCAPSGWPDCAVFLWDKGVMRDLNDLVSDSSLTLVDSGKINDLGQIVGLAFTRSGELHAFLASPDNDRSSETQNSSGLSKPPRSSAALPEVIQKTLERQMRYKSHHFGRAVRLQNLR
jgi:probable HAF family extracellular repeat protein